MQHCWQTERLRWDGYLHVDQCPPEHATPNPRPYLQKLMALLKKAEMGVVSDPHTGPLHTPVRELLEEEVLVCLGQDDISDAYYPHGRSNMLEVAFLASHMLWMTSAAERELGGKKPVRSSFRCGRFGFTCS